MEKVGILLAEAVTKIPRIRKRKVVVMLSYCGQGYFGMQRNHEMRTIEGELLNSMLKNEYIDEEAVQKPQIAYFQRAARTDKNVSAARQIVSLKMPEEVDIEKINDYLPPEIRVMGLKRVTKGFDAKNSCDARTYSYMVPTFAFAPLEVAVTEDYRLPPEKVQEIQAALDLYIGTKNYHNFTSRKRPNDPSAMRRIFDFKCGQPFEKDGLEYVILRVKGQSFMLHQIRKMIGLVIAYMRGFAGRETFQKCWGPERIDVPRAPGVGLMLDYVHYERYDQRYGSDGMHDVLTWDSVEEKVLKFCDEYIYTVVTKVENEEKSMMAWLTTLPYHTYDVRESGPPPTDSKETAQKSGGGQSAIGKAYMALVYKNGGEEPKFSKASKGFLEGDEDEVDGGEDEVPEKKPKIQAVLEN